jgi:amino acid transporter
MEQKHTRVLGTFTLAMMTVAAIVSLRNLSMTAEMGFSAVFFLCVAALVFFIPISLVTAELAASWPQSGGCYLWVSQAFGKPVGFVALWASWMASVSWFPTMLAFTATMLAHMLDPLLPNSALEHNTFFILGIMLAVFWGTTISNFYGLKFSGFLSSFGVLLGTLIPGALIIILGLAWIFFGKPSEIPLTFQSLIPDFKLDNLVLFGGVLLGLAGVELAAYHIRETKDPQKSYPRAMLIAAVLILGVYILGTLAISVVVPQQNLLLASGLIQAFQVFFASVGLAGLVPLIAFFLFIGAIAGINAWVIGPAKGLLVVAQDKFLPKWLERENNHGVPVALLLTQAIVGSLLAMVFLYIRDHSASIWFLTALSAQFTFVQYTLVFCAALRLRYLQPKTVRAFRVPAIWLVAGLGIISCIFSFAIVYAPHVKLVSIGLGSYCSLLTLSFVLLLSPALLLINFRTKN